MATRKGGVASETEEGNDEDCERLESPLTSESIEEIDITELENEDDVQSIEMISPVESEDSPVVSLGLSQSQNEGESTTTTTTGTTNSNTATTATAASLGGEAPIDSEETRLTGWLKLSGQGFRKITKHVWFVYDDDSGKLYFYRQPQDLIPLGEIDVRNASFTYDANNRDKPGTFEISSNGKSYSLEADDRVHMVYWLEALQKKRKAFSLRLSEYSHDFERFLSGRKTQLASSGLLGENRLPQDIQDGAGSNQNNSSNASGSSLSLLNLRKEIRKTMSTFRVQLGNKSNKVAEEWTVVDDSPSPPESPPPPLPTETTQWHVPSDFTDGAMKSNRSFSIPSVLTPTGSSPKDSKGLTTSCDSLVTVPEQPQASQSKISTSPSSNSSSQHGSSSSNTSGNGRSKFMSALRGNFSRSLKDKTGHSNPRAAKPFTVKESTSNVSSGANSSSRPAQSTFCSRCKVLGDDLFSVKEDLRAAEEELEANREIVRLLQKEVDVLRQQITTRNECDGMEEEQMMQVLHQKDKHVVELEHSRAAILEEKSMLAQKIRLEASELKDLRDQISMFQQTLTVKDEMIIHLTNQNQELKNNNRIENVSEMSQTSVGFDPNTLAVDTKELELLRKKCQEYEKNNIFQKNEIQELNELRKLDQARERKLIMNLAEHEAKYCQIQSKYLFLLNERQPVRGGEENSSQEAVNQLLKEALESENVHSEEIGDEKDAIFMGTKGKEYDRYGFLKYNADDLDDNDILRSRASILHHQSLEMEYMLRDVDEVTSKRIKWENFMVGQPSNKPLTPSSDLKTLVRLGVPYDFREKVWMSCINMCVGKRRQELGEGYYKDLEQRAHSSRFNPATKQIELDLLRTLPDNKFFEKIDSDGVRKLRCVLLSYSVYNPVIGYCQGLNRIAAIALLFLKEEEAFWCLVAVIEFLMPKDYYTATLAGAQADQRVLKDLVQERMPRLYAHLENHDVDLSLFTFNWFLTIFVDNVKTDLFLQVWDCFLYEGSKILFRFGLAFLKYAEEEILKQPSALMINRYMRSLGKSITDVKKVLSIAFQELNPFPMRFISNRRQYHMQIIKEELIELEAIRKDFKSQQSQEAKSSEKSGYYSEGDCDDI